MPIGLDTVLGINQARAAPALLTPDQLSSYIAVNADAPVSACWQAPIRRRGSTPGIGQIVAEELDVPFKSVTVIMGNTATSVNQGGASGSTGIHLGQADAHGRGRGAPCWSRWRSSTFQPTSSTSRMA